MLVLATNKLDHLDRAVTDRMDEMVEFPLPTLAEREKMVVRYFQEYILARAAPGTSIAIPSGSDRAVASDGSDNDSKVRTGVVVVCRRGARARQPRGVDALRLLCGILNRWASRLHRSAATQRRRVGIVCRRCGRLPNNRSVGAAAAVPAPRPSLLRTSPITCCWTWRERRKASVVVPWRKCCSTCRELYMPRRTAG